MTVRGELQTKKPQETESVEEPQRSAQVVESGAQAVESSVQEQSWKAERPQSESNGLEASLKPESLQIESRGAAQGCWRPEVQRMSSNELEQHWSWRQEGCCTLGCSRARLSCHS